MNEKDITEKLIDNSKLIHELGGRFKVRKSDWIVEIAEFKAGYKYPYLVVQDTAWISVIKCGLSIRNTREYFPIWSARKCKAWLREEGYAIGVFDHTQDESFGLNYMAIISRYFPKENDDLDGTDYLAPTEDEACTEAVIKVLKNDN